MGITLPTSIVSENIHEQAGPLSLALVLTFHMIRSFPLQPPIHESQLVQCMVRGLINAGQA